MNSESLRKAPFHLLLVEEQTRIILDIRRHRRCPEIEPRRTRPTKAAKITPESLVKKYGIEALKKIVAEIKEKA